ncbi:MAG: 16S rRNA (guanine(966)-N(2))-methyltransferase RsmD [Anaerolineales bacterium]|uniref:16S rRNA (guanine(966)-N(2))-methyltransferase RsmD n=1 Tax=Promineifilum sp. TaxID=2664178 RepID=UPI001DEC6E6F|nr:16S rRNA (guanine(966)-N(2))-methyltransferase RsmD [Anaerolineales bacterium]MCB8934552.1 16S rRNA (guanine(966)-N(2))-methyltransferase RsmD [Promineifilum sp.]MCO5179068.1 16S rRNA (guanine(966)-N(2))-methyltransferase RsmD [Promineifilum sp.]
MTARVISGKAKGRRLKLVPGDSTRPIMDRVKESLFNILGDVGGTRWLDLFAGTGQVGIEALSRGAAEVVFIDKARAAIQTIHDNLSHTRLTDGARVIHTDALAFLRQLGAPPFDVIYIAPPQYFELWITALRAVDEAASTWLTSDGVAIVQIDPREFQDLALVNLMLTDQRRYGNTMLCFYRRETDEEE